MLLQSRETLTKRESNPRALGSLDLDGRPRRGTQVAMRALWIRSPVSNLMIPSGATSSVASTSTISFLEGKEQAAAIRRMYADYDVKLNPSCDMARHISAAIEVSDKWLLNKTKEIQTGTLVRGIQMDKIATSLLAARNSKKIRQYLRHLTSGSLDVFNRRPSRAKSALWELELHALLLRQSVTVELEEPDTIAHVNNWPIAIACKKTYSDENVEKTLSRGVAQNEKVSSYGLIAINIDDLWPANQIRASTSDEELGHSLRQENAEFLRRHDRYFRKYLSSGRLMGVMVAGGGIAHVGRSFQSARQFTTWAMPNLEPAKAKLLEILQSRLQSGWRA